MDISELLSRTVSGLGFELAAWDKAGRGGLLRVFIDKADGINVEDCAEVSRHLSRVLEVENIRYDRLEVSSPGLDRMLRDERDFVRFAGARAKVKVRAPVNGQRNFTGTIGTVADGALELAIEGGCVSLALANLDSARLIPSL